MNMMIFHVRDDNFSRLNVLRCVRRKKRTFKHILSSLILPHFIAIDSIQTEMMQQQQQFFICMVNFFTPI